MNKNDFIEYLRNNVEIDLEATLQTISHFSKQINNNRHFCDTVIKLTCRYNSLKKDIVSGHLSLEQEKRELAKITNAVIILINDLENYGDLLLETKILHKNNITNRLPDIFIKKMEIDFERQYHYIEDIQNILKKENNIEQKDILEEKVQRYIDNINKLKVFYSKECNEKYDIDENSFLSAISELEYNIINKLNIFSENIETANNAIINKLEQEHKLTTNLIISKLDQIDIDTVNFICKEIDLMRISEEEITKTLSIICSSIENIKDQQIKTTIDNINSSKDNYTAKFKLILPLIPFLLNMEQEFKLNGFLNSFWKKWRQCLL